MIVNVAEKGEMLRCPTGLDGFPDRSPLRRLCLHTPGGAFGRKTWKALCAFVCLSSASSTFFAIRLVFSGHEDVTNCCCPSGPRVCFLADLLTFFGSLFSKGPDETPLI